MKRETIILILGVGLLAVNCSPKATTAIEQFPSNRFKKVPCGNHYTPYGEKDNCCIKDSLKWESFHRFQKRAKDSGWLYCGQLMPLDTCAVHKDTCYQIL